MKPSTSNTLEVGKFPGIPPHKGSWYSIVNDKFAQKPQVVPQTFSNIAKPGYGSEAPATVQQKDLVKLEYMIREILALLTSSPRSGWLVSRVSTTCASQGTRERGCLINSVLPWTGPQGSRSCCSSTP